MERRAPFDGLDERLSDFFLQVAGLASDHAWMERMLAAWSPRVGTPEEPP